MKIVFLIAASLTANLAFAQPKVITQAIITTSTNVIAPDEDDETASQMQGAREGGGEGRGGGMGAMMRNMMDGETKSTTYIKNEMVKTDLKSETLKSTIYRDNKNKTTYTITEMMGNKMGIKSTDADAEDMKKRMDSMRAEREKKDTSNKPRMRNVDPSINVVYVDESKKIAGYNCKKALIIKDRFVKKDTTIVWYNPEMKFENVPSTGGTSGFGSFANNFGGGDGFEKVNGFVMLYERKMPRGRMMEVKVTKIVTDKEIAEADFVAPKDIEYKTMKEMMGGQGGREVRMFMGGRRE